jgi:GxxExxY protein
MDLIYQNEYYDIKKACINIKEKLGIGFLEKIYENALAIELTSLGFNVKQQQPFDVLYENEIIGTYIADLIVNDSIIIEIKTADQISNSHKAQILNYLKITNLKLGIIINFSKKTNSFDIERIPNFTK